MTEGDLLVRGARLPDWQAPEDANRVPAGAMSDIRVSGGRITALAPALEPAEDEEVLEADGAVVLPGLHDHHVHLRSLVAAGRSVAVGPSDVRGPDELGAALRRAPVDSRGWRRAVGYHESVAGAIDRYALDGLAPGLRVRVQHRTGALWVLSSAGVEALGLDTVDADGIERDGDGIPTGRLFRMDDWLAHRLPDEDPVTDIARVSRRLAARGVTGLTDATPGATVTGVTALVAAVADGEVLQRLHVMCPPEVEVPPHRLVSRGPVKVLLDDDDLPALDDLVATVRTAHAARVPVAVHCVTPAQLVLTVAAFATAGATARDRIEHGAVISDDLVNGVADLGISVVTNPSFVYERGEAYLVDVEARDRPFLYRCRSLLAAGIPVAAGTDAPFGSSDPWAAVTAARTRRTRAGRSLGADEGVPLLVALSLFAGFPEEPGRHRRIAVGEVGDLCLLADGVVPRPDGPGGVFATVVAGRIVHRTD